MVKLAESNRKKNLCFLETSCEETKHSLKKSKIGEAEDRIFGR